MRKLTLAAVLLLSAHALAAQTPKYAVTGKLELGGEGGWDYLTVEPGSKRLFISRSTHVQVADLTTGKLAADLPNTPGVHGISLVPELNRGFTTNGRDATMTVFDLKSLQPLDMVHLDAKNPDAILYDTATHHVYSLNHSSGDVSVIDPGTAKVLGTVHTGGVVEAAASDGKGRIFVNIEDVSEIVVIDGNGMKALAHWPLAPCEEPTGLAIDRVHKRLFAGCGNKLMAVLDSETGKVIATLPIGSGVDGVAFDPALQLVFTSNGEGTVTIIHEDDANHFTVVQNVTTQRGARTIALDLATHKLYLPTASYGPAAAPTAEQPRPRAPLIPNSFVILVLEPQR